ncbi:hypothetical protein Mal64_18270 [Pseudobythopirellula maris]|uniref:Uncharacterized protein n=1 Tax=Pseudobythopirellula maris TaxID=2527991 RepID=A0A5C5ZMZ0_9BACT|nr:hypothetical protein [Pseudobythopirellula maris]TWT88347.1 hypothetical protein Mal64_18270 [Pseudobythopirellula maris]
MNRRKFAFWIGAGLFGLAERLRADSLDTLAAAAMRATEPTAAPPPAAGAAEALATGVDGAEHWTAASNKTWGWFVRETRVDDEWKVTGITRPRKKSTGEPFLEAEGYLDDELAPEGLRLGDSPAMPGDYTHDSDYTRDSAGAYGGPAEETPDETIDDDGPEPDPGHPHPTRKAREGRPPSRWLRSLEAGELAYWLGLVELPEAGVSGMTYWEHLTRDHGFSPAKIEGLTKPQLASLHAAAHYGY